MIHSFSKFIQNSAIFESIQVSGLDKEQPWGHFKVDVVSDKPDFEQCKEFYYNVVLPHLNIRDFKDLLDKSKLPDCEVITHIKTCKSFVDKALHRSKDTSKFHDILRGAILTKDLHDAEKVVERLREYGDVSEVDFKNPGETTTGYENSWHVSVKIKGIHCEIQVMPKSMWIFKKKTHKDYVRDRS